MSVTPIVTLLGVAKSFRKERASYLRFPDVPQRFLYLKDFSILRLFEIVKNVLLLKNFEIVGRLLRI